MMKDSTPNKVFQDIHVAAPTVAPDCATINPCSQSCLNGIVQEKICDAFIDFAAPSQQQNGKQAFQAAPSFLC